MIEQCNQTDGRFVIQRGAISNRVNQASRGTVGTIQVIQSGREDKLFEQAAKTRLLSVEQDHFKVKHVSRLNTSFGSNELHKVRMMTLSDCFQGSEFTIICLPICSAIALGSTSTVKLSSNETGNGEQLRLLIERKAFLTVKVNSQCRNAKDCTQSVSISSTAVS